MENTDNEYVFDLKGAELPNIIQHKTYEIKQSDKYTKGSYLLYLPPSYSSDAEKRYPIIYFLHGGGGNVEDPIWMIKNYDRAIRENKMKEVILVAPKGTGRYIDSINPKFQYPTESIFIKDLLPHVENSYRIINERKSRGIEGFSMGGYGALRFGFKYSDIFGVLLVEAPSIYRNLEDDHDFVGNEFNHDQEYFEKIGPWNLAKVHEQIFNDSGNVLRIIVGENDELLETEFKYHIYLKDIGVRHEYYTVPNAKHVYSETLLNYKDEAFKFWNQHLSA